MQITTAPEPPLFDSLPLIQARAFTLSQKIFKFFDFFTDN